MTISRQFSDLNTTFLREFTSPSITYGQSHASPEEIFGALFEDVQNSGIFEDSKTFADAIPRKVAALIFEAYQQEKEGPTFSIARFVQSNFRIPIPITSTFTPDKQRSVSEHIDRLWAVLTRQPEDEEPGGSLIPLPNPYVVPGGRFREIYYWDTYFTMLGLKEAGRTDLIGQMVDNFAYLIDTFGFIPTANRTYYLSRSQP
ncbi:hypothetical protein LC612_38740, partial [Nostoc sp. CHAB 5834]|nr:hypothetical protein [Nostoc sp. CHAB 5834]